MSYERRKLIKTLKEKPVKPLDFLQDAIYRCLDRIRDEIDSALLERETEKFFGVKFDEITEELVVKTIKEIFHKYRLVDPSLIKTLFEENESLRAEQESLRKSELAKIGLDRNFSTEDLAEGVSSAFRIVSSVPEFANAIRLANRLNMDVIELTFLALKDL